MNNIDIIDINNIIDTSMQPRRPTQKVTNKRKLITDYLFHIIITCTIIIGSVLFFSTEGINSPPTSQQQKQQKESPQEVGVKTMSKTKNPKIIYDLALSKGGDNDNDNDDHHPTLLRYAAKEEMDDGTYQSISVYRWATLLLLDDRNNLIIQFNDILKNSNMDAFFFETKGVTYHNSKIKNFEFVLIESNYLKNFADTKQDSITFGNHLNCDPIPIVPSFVNNGDEEEKFATTPSSSKKQQSQQQLRQQASSESACVFPNLGGDSILIAPTLLLDDDNKSNSSNNNVYGHLGAFVRRATTKQIIETWKLVLQTYLQRLIYYHNNQTTVWFSTDGTGVAWLHFRLDPKPKYYDYIEFANEN